MESNRTNPAVTVLGGFLSGIVAGLFCIRRDMQAHEPTVIEKMKQFEDRLYAEGESRAATLEEIKQEARHTASLPK